MVNNDPDNRNRLNDEGEKGKPLENEIRAEDTVPDLDGDGFIGNTGGFYGGTSYLGSNYTEGWGTPEGTPREVEGNFGAAGVKDDRTEEERRIDNVEESE